MTRLILVTLLASSLAAAASPVAKISSSAPFRLDGKTVPVAGVPNWPVTAGDQIAMGSRPGEIRFHDGTLVFVHPRTRVTIDVSSGKTLVRLLAGAMSYKRPANSTVSLAGLKNQPVSAASLQGKLAVTSAGAFWNPLEQSFYQFGPGAAGSRRPQQAGDLGNVNMNPNPYNLDAIQGYRDFEPDWGTPPGDGGQGTAPPPAATEPGQPAPTSNYRP